MGKRARKTLSRVLLGSVAERVVRTAKVPVLTVPTTESSEDGPTDQGQRSMRIPTRILVATDFSEPAARAMAFAKVLRKRLGTAMDVAHIQFDPFYGYKELPKQPVWPSQKHAEAYLLGLSALLEKTVQESFGSQGADIATHVRRGAPGQEILELASETGADMICIGTTGKGAVERFLVGSVALNVLRKSHVPVLTVH